MYQKTEGHAQGVILVMKNPNGYGSVIKLGGKRRRPFGVRVTDGWEINEKTGKEKQIFKYVDYYKTRPEAMIGLAEYNKDPYDIDARKITFKEMYEKWSKEKYKIGKDDEASKSLIDGYTTAYNNSSTLYDIAFNDIRAHHMQDIIDTLGLGYSSNNKLNGLFNQMYAYARKRDIVEKDYSEFVKVPADDKPSSKKPFTDDEIKMLWDKIDEHELVDATLIMIYTGLRVGELLTIEKDDINLEDRFLTGGLKTDAGKNRVVPLNKKIIPLIEKRKNSKGKFLFLNSKGDRMTYQIFRRRWVAMRKELKLVHTIHECRHTFGTLMDNANANKVSIKRIMGHVISDVTDGVYTHKDLEQLLIAIDLI